MDFTDLIESIPEEWTICCVQSKKTESGSRSEPTYTPYYNVDFTQPTLMIFGSESRGLSPEIIATLQQNNRKIVNTFIPINTEVDSLNVAMAASILIYEMVRSYSYFFCHYVVRVCV